MCAAPRSLDTDGKIMKSILDSSFRYTPSAQTDVRKTFARLRREQRKADLARVQTIVASVPVLPVKPRLISESRKA